MALDDADLRLDNYIDVDYFINLQSSTKEMVDSVQNLSLAVKNNNEESIDIEEEQYLAFTKSVTNIFEDLNTEEYEAFKTLAEEDVEIAGMLDMIENGFYNENEESLSQTLMAANVVKLCNATFEIGNLLALQGVCGSAISCIKGAYNAMIGFVKAFFLPTWAKVAGITACILVITTIVVINWDKIKPVFTQMANYFIDSAKKLASTVSTVFNSIYQTASKSKSDEVQKEIDDLLDGAEKGRETNGKSEQYQKKGGFDQANKDYDKLNPNDSKEIDTSYGKGRTGTLDDGSKVNVRPGSSQGDATLEIQLPNGRRIKIRYGD